jgi:hypothetical protein
VQHGIWLRARLTVDPALADADLQRLIIEFPGGEYSDDAHFRTALLSVSRGREAKARDHLRALVRDYPDSPLRAEAMDWLERRGLDWESAGEREWVPAEPPLDSSAPGAPVTVQVGAFLDPARALALADRIESLGYSPRLVRLPGNDLVRVRIGRYGAREPADLLAAELRTKGIDCTLSFDAHREVRAGGGAAPPL